MAIKYFLDLDIATGEYVRRTALSSSAGAASADSIVRTGPDGKLDVSFIPDMNAAVETYTASADITAYSFVNFHNVAGRRMRSALAVDNTKPAMGFCPDGALTGASAAVYFGGILILDGTGLVAADEGKLLFLSAASAGKAAKTPPSADSNIVQVVARIVEVAASARAQIIVNPHYVRIMP